LLKVVASVKTTVQVPEPDENTPILADAAVNVYEPTDAYPVVALSKLLACAFPEAFNATNVFVVPNADE
jgi:hypothetical protein